MPAFLPLAFFQGWILSGIWTRAVLRGAMIDMVRLPASLIRHTRFPSLPPCLHMGSPSRFNILHVEARKSMWHPRGEENVLWVPSAWNLEALSLG